MSEVFDKATEKAEEGLAGLGERLYSEYEKLPWYKQLLLAIAPVTGETISAYETPIFAEKTKEAYKKGDYLETAGHGALTGLSVLGAIPFLGAGIRGVKAGVKGARKGLASLDKPLEVSTAGQFTTTIDIPSGSGEIRSIKIPVFNQMYADTPLTPLPNKVIEAKKRATAAETKLQQFLSESIDGVTVHNYNPQQQAAVTRANRAVQKALREAFPKLSTNNEINALTALENGIPGFPMEKLTK